jgi:hypothetical protein
MSATEPRKNLITQSVVPFPTSIASKPCSRINDNASLHTAIEYSMFRCISNIRDQSLPGNNVSYVPFLVVL